MIVHILYLCSLSLSIFENKMEITQIKFVKFHENEYK